MNKSKHELGRRFQKYYTEFNSLGLAVDLSRMNFHDDFIVQMEDRFRLALKQMSDLEGGAISNPDEKRMVGHYWLRNPSLAPTLEIRRQIEKTLAEIKQFVSQIHNGEIQGQRGRFKNMLIIGIGGSILGPQFVSNALGNPKADKLKAYYLDNTDPDGFDRTLAMLDGELGQTICLVTSKSGKTRETHNGMIEVESAFKAVGLNFARHAVAITEKSSDLDKNATNQNWLKSFEIWNWVGGRTSELSAVGLLPAALQGFDYEGMIAGAKDCDSVTKADNIRDNPALQLGAAWFLSGNGKGANYMVVLPYKDRLELFAKYLQQLIMESIGKKFDLNGQIVHQGLVVLGNKGSSDQHSYIQQLRDGPNNFFVTFIETLKERNRASFYVKPDVTSGDYLSAFLLGTRTALHECGRQSLTITIKDVSAYSIGVLIALFERSVGIYASFININPYHQPGVEAGKLASENMIQLQCSIIDLFKANRGIAMSCEDIATKTGQLDNIEYIFKICNRLAESFDRGIFKESGVTPFDSKFGIH